MSTKAPDAVDLAWMKRWTALDKEGVRTPWLPQNMLVCIPADAFGMRRLPSRPLDPTWFGDKTRMQKVGCVKIEQHVREDRTVYYRVKVLGETGYAVWPS
jgi:hypothetical protein